MLEVGRGGGSTSQGSVRVHGGVKTLSCHFRLFKVIVFYENGSSEVFPNFRIRCRVEKGVDCAIFHNFDGPFRVQLIFLWYYVCSGV